MVAPFPLPCLGGPAPVRCCSGSDATDASLLGRTVLDYQQLADILDKSHGCMTAGLSGVSLDGSQSADPCPAGSAAHGTSGDTSAETSDNTFAIDIRNVRLLQVLSWSADSDGFIGVKVY